MEMSMNKGRVLLTWCQFDIVLLTSGARQWWMFI